MSDILKIEDDTSLVREVSSNAILTVDDVGLSAYRKRKEQHNKVAKLESSVESLAGDMNTVKTLLERLINDSNR